VTYEEGETYLQRVGKIQPNLIFFFFFFFFSSSSSSSSLMGVRGKPQMYRSLTGLLYRPL
jgi:hypothetical protein